VKDKLKQSDIYLKTLTKSGSLHWLHWLIIIFSTVLTIAAWSYSTKLLNEKIEAKFQRESTYIINHIVERMGLYESSLWSAVGLMKANDGEINHQQWSDFAKTLKIEKTHSGINGISVIYNIKPDQLEEYLFFQRNDRPEYSIFPKHDQNEHWPTTYIEPEDLNKNAIGLDIAYETNRYTAVIRARDTGTAQITGPIRLVQDEKSTPGFLFFAPFYSAGTQLDDPQQRQKNILGVISSPFIMSKLMDGMLSQDNRHINLTIRDGDDLELYSDNDTMRDPKPLFSKEQVVHMYGRDWAVQFESDLSFRSAVNSEQPTRILIGGVIFDLLLFIFFVFLIKANRDALSYAEFVTKEVRSQKEQLEQSNQHMMMQTEMLEKSNKDLQQFSYIASHDLKSPLNAIKQLASWVKEDCDSILPEESKNHLTLLQKRSDRMMKLLSDLLSYSRLSKGESYDYQWINLHQMVADTFDVVGNPEGFSFEAPDINLYLPFVPFEILIRNLVSNSIKHHDKEQGNISVRYQNLLGNHVIEVEDDGAGIPENLHEKAMEMFQTLKPRDEVEGSGMGLAIIKKIVEKNGGSITIKSKDTRGIIFVVTWPDNVEPTSEFG